MTDIPEQNVANGHSESDAERWQRISEGGARPQDFRWVIDRLRDAYSVLVFADGLALSQTGSPLADLYAPDYLPAQTTLQLAGCWQRGTFAHADAMKARQP